MKNKTDYDSDSNRLKLLVGMAGIALVVTLAVVLSRGLSNKGLAALVGTICTLGLLVTTGLLIILVRQYYDSY